MARTLTFKVRLDEQDRKWLDAISEHYRAPAAVSVRMLIKAEWDRISAGQHKKEDCGGT